METTFSMTKEMVKKIVGMMAMKNIMVNHSDEAITDELIMLSIADANIALMNAFKDCENLYNLKWEMIKE